jgi:lipopolysaccharide export system permease protein
MSISIVFDLSEKLNEFIANGAPWNEIIFVYYSNFFIYYGVQFSYLLNFISVIWFTSKMAGNTEIVPILSAGIGFNRFLRPYFISSAILVVVTILMYNFVLPGSNKSRIDFEETYYRVKINKSNFRMQVNDDQLLYFYQYSASTNRIKYFSLETWDKHDLKSVLLAEIAIGDSMSSNWQLERGSIRHIGEFNDDVSFFNQLDTNLAFGIKDLIFRSNIIEAMNYTELNKFIDEQKLKGSDRISTYLLEKHKRWASPFAIFILTLIGVSVSSKKTRGGLGINIAIGLGICFLYIFAMQMTTVAALNMGFTPFLAVWIPNIIFSFIAYFLYVKAPK